MPRKVCPKCQLTHGVRRLVCECGYDFGVKRKTSASNVPGPVVYEFPYPEPGTWIFMRPKGLPPLTPPDDLPPGPLPANIIKQQVSFEGLGFCIYNFIHVDRIADSHLSELWMKARTAMHEVARYLDQIAWEET